MKEYNKEKLHEYAKELFALCLSKGLDFEYIEHTETIIVTDVGESYIDEDCFDAKIIHLMPIWELIEKVKAL